MTITDDLTSVFREVFNNPGIVLSPEQTANDIEGWDSFSHINLIIAVESKFNIQFKQREALGFKNIGELIKNIETKLG
jgi:acyl carrier protein